MFNNQEVRFFTTSDRKEIKTIAIRVFNSLLKFLSSVFYIGLVYFIIFLITSFFSISSPIGGLGNNDDFYLDWRVGSTDNYEDLAIIQSDALNSIKNSFSLELDNNDDYFKLVFRKESLYLSKPSNLIFSGPPGVGKSHGAESLAKIVSSYYTVISAGSLQEIFVGSGAKKWNSIIKQAKKKSLGKKKPVLIIVEEIDSLARKAEKFGGGDDTLLNNFLATIDNVKNSEFNILIIGTTNYIDCIPESAKRAGRFQVVKFNYLKTKDEYIKLISLVKRSIEENFNVETDENKFPEDYSFFVFREVFWNNLAEKLFERRRINFTFSDIYECLVSLIKRNTIMFYQLMKDNSNDIFDLINKFLIFDEEKLDFVLKEIVNLKMDRNN